MQQSYKLVIYFITINKLYIINPTLVKFREFKLETLTD